MFIEELRNELEYWKQLHKGTHGEWSKSYNIDYLKGKLDAEAHAISRLESLLLEFEKIARLANPSL